MELRIGCAGWAIPAPHASSFPGVGSHLERYARVLPAVEINSSFYRPHKPETYARWGRSVPEGFRFSVKAPREITHKRRLVDVEPQLRAFLAQVCALGPALGPILVQLPPSLAFDTGRVRAFFETLRDLHDGGVVCEPRHPSWFAAGPEALLEQLRVGHVAADPALVPDAASPGGWRGLAYFRLHGSPQVYQSAYSESFLRSLSETLVSLAGRGPAWCIFDNTAAGAAQPNALKLLEVCRSLEGI